MEEVASTAKLVDAPAFDVGGGAPTATFPRSEIEAAVQDDAGVDLFLEIARIQNGERDDRTVKVAWERSDLEALLERASGDSVTLTFDQAELERMLVRLKRRTLRVVDVGCPGVLDVGAQHMRDVPRPREFDEPVDTRRKRLRIANVEPPGVQRVAGQQYSGPPVIDRNGGALVAGNG